MPTHTKYSEVGYTPNNLRCLLRKHGLTMAQCADKLGVAHRTVQGWVAPVSSKSHRDMPLKQWQALQKIFEETA